MAETARNYIFKRNQSSDNRSHGFGAKFLLKKLSASDFSYERKSALTLGFDTFSLGIQNNDMMSIIAFNNFE